MIQGSFRAAALACAALAMGCHARWFPLASAPDRPVREGAADGPLNATARGALSREGWSRGFRYELPARGSLLVEAAPEDAESQLDVEVYGAGEAPLASAEGRPGARLTVPGLSAGTVYVVVKEDWRGAREVRFRLTAVFAPQDPDWANGPQKSRTGARPLPADRGLVSDSVDYSAMRRTHFWKIALPADGALTVRFQPRGERLTAVLIPPEGAPEPIDPGEGLAREDLPAGEYLVEVSADGAGDKGDYQLSTRFEPAGACRNGGPACTIEGAENLNLPADSRTADVDFGRSMRFHFYRLAVKEKGRLTIVFKVLEPQRGSKVAAFLLRKPDDAGERIEGAARTVSLEAGDVYLKVAATEAGDFARYAVTSIFQPASYISGDVVEIQRRPICLLTVSAGSNQGVRTAAGCTVVGRSGAAPSDACVVAAVYPNLSKIRPLAPGCRVAPTSKVQIAAQ